MKKTALKKRLALLKTTIKPLSSEELAKVVGGYTAAAGDGGGTGAGDPSIVAIGFNPTICCQYTIRFA